MAKKGELLDLQKTGQAFYKAKKYAEALDAFSKAIVLARKWSPSDVLTILDQRIPVHAKLGNISLARQDAISMIRADKSDGRGYLRCGQLDRLEDKLSASLNWYEHGLKQVSESDPFYSTLKAQREKVTALLDKKLVLSNSRDPVCALPAELIQFILSYLDYVDAVRSLCVSKMWKQILSRLKPLIDTIDFGDARRVINYKMMVAALKRLGSSPKVLIMNDLAEPANNLLRMNLERWRNYSQLEELAISSTVFGLELLPFDKYNLKSLTVKHGKLRGHIPGHIVAEILKSCKTLESARFANVQGCLTGQGDTNWVDPLHCPTVRILSFSGGFGSIDHLVIHPTFLACFPHLEELECHHLKICETDEPFDLSAQRRLRKIYFSTCSIPWWPILPSSIEVWDNYNTETSFGARGQVTHLGELVKLRFLRFNNTSPTPACQSFLQHTTPRGTITHLDIRGTSARSVDDSFFFLHLLSEMHLTNLKELALDGTQDEILMTTLALSSLGQLEVLSMYASPLLGVHIIDLLKRPSNRLRKITLIDCENISADTIKWARDRGVIMHVKRSQNHSKRY